LNEVEQVAVYREERMDAVVAHVDSGRVVDLNISTKLKQSIPAQDGKAPAQEDVFLELIGKKLVNPEEEESLP
jgi:hypothetical protein